MMKYRFRSLGAYLLVFLVITASIHMLRPSFPLQFSSAEIQRPIFTTNSRQSGTDQSVVFIQPIFTQAAYGNNNPDHHGFYDYYFGRCGQKCLTVPIPKIFNGSYDTGAQSNNILLREHYSHITDIDVDKDPDILEGYGTVILLHNEYVTQREFDAITHHPHVIYLYPNSLFAEVKVDYDKNTITLVRGHWYPDKKIVNGFNWKYDNTKFESDTACTYLHFYTIYNGEMLNCYPEYIIYFDPELLHAIKNFIYNYTASYSKTTAPS